MKRFIIKTAEIKKACLAEVMKIMGDDNIEVIIQPHEEDKTAEQRNFFHLLCRELCATTGYSEGEMKELIKQEILGTTVIEFAGRTREVTTSTETLNRKGYADLIEGAYRIGAEAGVVLPPPLWHE